MKKIILSVVCIASFFSLLSADIGTGNFKFLLEEEKIKKVYYDKNFKKLIVQVVNDGSNRSGYAQYVGMEVQSKKLNEHVDSIYIKDITCSDDKIKNGECSSLGKVRKAPSGGYIF